MSNAISEETTTGAEGVARNMPVSTGIVGEFAPLDEFNVSFAVRAASLTAFPPEWVVHGSVRNVGADTLPIAIFNLGPKHLSQTVKVGGLPDGYFGTMELTLTEGKGPSFTVKYSLKKGQTVPFTRKGTYVFYWSA